MHLHDAYLLALKKKGSDIELYLHKDGGWGEDSTPYMKLVFHNVSKLEREKGLVLRTRKNRDGELYSNCQYLYDELYRTDNGYELHLLLGTAKALRYLTVGAENIYIIDNINL